MNVGGFEVPVEFNISGWLSSSWIWVVVVGIIGFLLVIAVVILLFFMTYKRKIVVFEEQGGQLIPVMKTRGRIVRLGAGGEEIMKTLVGGYYLSAYGKTVGKNSYWYLKGTDGYLYNFILDKYGTPIFIDGDMRLTNVAINRMSQQTYGKVSWLEKHGVHLLLFVFLCVLVLGMWGIIGKLGEAIAPLTQSIEQNAALTEANGKIASQLSGLLRNMGNVDPTPTSGLAPAGAG